jgi:hypothetical protein
VLAGHVGLERRVRLDGTGIPIEVRVEDADPEAVQRLAEGSGLRVKAAAGGDEDGERGAEHASAASCGSIGRIRPATAPHPGTPSARGTIPFDVATLGLASLLRSGPASRVLIVSVLVNPADAVRTGALLGLQDTTAFGSASLAFLRSTKGPVGAAGLLSLSVFLWITVPFAWAVRRLGKADL